jgi:hypothetical protein
MNKFPLRHVSVRVPWHDAGWAGVVCSAPALNGAQDEVVAELLSSLGAMGIGPLGAVDRAPAFVEKRVWRTENNGNGAEAAKSALDAAITKRPLDNLLLRIWRGAPPSMTERIQLLSLSGGGYRGLYTAGYWSNWRRQRAGRWAMLRAHRGHLYRRDPCLPSRLR